MKQTYFIFLLNIMIFLFAKNVYSQDINFSCDFSKGKWVADSIGNSGYRYFVTTAYECPEFDTFFADIHTRLDIITKLGKPNFVEIGKTGDHTLGYHIYENTHLRQTLCFVLDKTGNIKVILNNLTGG